MLNPALALADALRRVEVWDDSGSLNNRSKQDMNCGWFVFSTEPSEWPLNFLVFMVRQLVALIT